jgi:outer membrane protein TolC
MQLDFITQLNAEIELYKKQLLLNNHRFELLQAIAALETELGGSIPSIALQQQ